MTVKVEKEQVGALAEYLAGLLAKLPAAEAAPEDPTLLEPITPAWAVRSLGVGYDVERRQRLGQARPRSSCWTGTARAAGRSPSAGTAESVL